MAFVDEISLNFGDFDSLDHMLSYKDPSALWKEDIQSLMEQPPTQTPTLTPPSLRPNDEPSGPCFTGEYQLQSMSCSELGGIGGDDLSKQVSESAAASTAFSQGGPIGSWTQSLPDLTTPVARKQKKGRKVSLDKQKTTRQKIGAEDLQKHFGKTRAEAAKSLDVSVSTLKRKSRMSGIAFWPFNKSKNKAMSAKIVDESLLSPTSSSYMVVDPVSSMQPESEISPPSKQLGTETDADKEEKPMTVKVRYGDEFVKFEFFSASKADLEEEISRRYKLMVGGFKIKYLDDEKEWISITCDADLQLCKRSVGMTTIKMLVLLQSPT